jgi:hypothetical protein
MQLLLVIFYWIKNVTCFLLKKIRYTALHIYVVLSDAFSVICGVLCFEL